MKKLIINIILYIFPLIIFACGGDTVKSPNETITESFGISSETVLSSNSGEEELTPHTTEESVVSAKSEISNEESSAELTSLSEQSSGEDEDQDNDKILDNVDNCKDIANPDQSDNDSDKIGDACDDDDDNDKVLDTSDNCKLIPNPDQKNNDNDVLGDACDTDDDNDGINDTLDNCPLTPNTNQKNSDSDSYGDLCDNCPAISNEDQSDIDQDKVGNPCDNCYDLSNPKQEDNDLDKIGDVCDNCPQNENKDQKDGDNDKIGDVCDNCPNLANYKQEDNDNDKVGNICDNCPNNKNEDQKDGDNDKIGDVCDNCPQNENEDQKDNDLDKIGDLCDNCPTLANLDQKDNDNDKVGNICDNCPNNKNEDQKDGDNDKIGDVCDNCPTLFNPKQEDNDNDKIGDICDTDKDGDEISDDIDNCPDYYNPDQKVPYPADLKGGTGGCFVNGKVTIKVIDSRNGAGIESAFVMIGNALNSPFPLNYTFTDEDGNAIISNPQLKGPYDITVAAFGFVFFTLLGVTANDLVIPLSPQVTPTSPPIYTVTGNIAGNFSDPSLTNLYAGFVLEKMNIDQVVNINLNSIILPSKEVEIIPGVVLPIPMNIAIPMQSISGFPIVIDYMLPVSGTSSTDLTALSAIIPITGGNSVTSCIESSTEGDIIDKAKLFSCLLSILNYDLGGIKANLKVNKDISTDINITNKLETTMKVIVSNFPSNLDGIAVSFMNDIEFRKFYPIGVQTLLEGVKEANLTTLEAKGPYANLIYSAGVSFSDLSEGTHANVGIFKRNLNRNNKNVTFNNFFKPISDSAMKYSGRTFEYPAVENKSTNPPSPNADIVSSYFGKSVNVEFPPNSKMYISFYQPYWEVHAQGTYTSFTLPKIPTSSEVGQPVPTSPVGVTLWKLRFSALTDCKSFNYNFYSFSSYGKCVTHTSFNDKIVNLKN